MPEDEAKYHLKRCVDSGLWIADASQAAEKGDGAADVKEDVKEEPVYEEPGASASASAPATETKPNVAIDDVD